MTERRVSGAAKRMSAPRAIWKPPPRQLPCRAAITGTGTAHPVVGCALEPVRHGAPNVLEQAVESRVGGHHAHDVEARAEARALAVQHDRAHARLGADALGGADDALEHRHVEGVVLLGPRQRDDGDVIIDLDSDALAHQRGDYLRSGLFGPVAVELPVTAARIEQFFMRAALDDSAVLEHDDPAGVADRREPVRDHQRGAPRRPAGAAPARSASRCARPRSRSPRRGRGCADRQRAPARRRSAGAGRPRAGRRARRPRFRSRARAP